MTIEKFAKTTCQITHLLVISIEWKINKILVVTFSLIVLHSFIIGVKNAIFTKSQNKACRFL